MAERTDISLGVTVEPEVTPTGAPGNVVYSFPVVIEVLGPAPPAGASPAHRDETLRSAAKVLAK